MSGAWSPEQRERFSSTIADRRQQRPVAVKTKRQRGAKADPFVRCSTPMPTGHFCRLPHGHPPAVGHRQRIKGPYALAVVHAMTGVDLASHEPEDERDEPARLRAVVEAVAEVPASVETDETGTVAPPSVVRQLAALAEQVEAMRFTMLRVEDRLCLLISAAGIRPVPPPVPAGKDPDLVDAFRSLHVRLLRLERSNVTSGDWEEWIDEILQTVRQTDRKMARIAPAATRKRAIVP